MLAILGMLTGFYFASVNYNNGSLLNLPMGLGIFFLIWWFLSRRRVFSITSDGSSKLIFATQGMGARQLTSFTEQLQSAIAERMKMLNK